MKDTEAHGSGPTRNLRDRWGPMSFVVAEGNNSSPSCELKLVYPIRLWNDETNLKKKFADNAWSCFQQRIEAVTAGKTRRGAIEKLWTKATASDKGLSELSAAVRQLLDNNTVRVWTTGAQALAMFFRTQTVEWSACQEKGGAPIPIRFSGLEVWASNSGVGYLVISITLKNPAADAALASFLDLVYYSRYLGRGGHASLHGRFESNPKHADAAQTPPTLEFCTEQWSADGTHASKVKTSIEALCT